MNVTFACPRCERAARVQLADEPRFLACPACGQEIEIPAGAFQQGHLRRCLVCPSTDLFVRKDFPQRLGVALVVVGVVGSSWAWYHGNVIATFAILFATALADLVLYLAIGEALMCYRCHAEYRQLQTLEDHAAFDLETHERYRQMAARLNDRQRGQAVDGSRT